MKLKIKPKKKYRIKKYGRVRPMLLAVLILLTGMLIENKSWLQFGVVVLIALFIGGYYQYRAPHR